MLASLTLLPALLGFAGERIELTRWRGLIAALFVALGLVGVGLKVPALSAAFLLAVVVLIARALRQPAEAARCPAARRSRAARPPRTGGAG